MGVCAGNLLHHAAGEGRAASEVLDELEIGLVLGYEKRVQQRRTISGVLDPDGFLDGRAARHDDHHASIEEGVVQRRERVGLGRHNLAEIALDAWIVDRLLERLHDAARITAHGHSDVAGERIELRQVEPAQAGAAPTLGALIGHRQPLERFKRPQTHRRQPIRLVAAPRQFLGRLARQGEAGTCTYFGNHGALADGAFHLEREQPVQLDRVLHR